MNTANNLLYLIVSALLSLMGVSGVFGKRNISGIAVSLEFPEEIYANTTVPVKIKIANSRRFMPAFLIRIKAGNEDLLVPFIDRKSTDVRYMNFEFPMRGVQFIENIYISSVFPFNFFVRFRQVPKIYEIIVFPEPKDCQWQSPLERSRKTRGEKGSDKSGYESDIISLREYSYGDPLKYLHWKASAKTGTLITKELSALLLQPVVIDFEKVPVKEIEKRVSCITHAILKYHKQNIPVGLKIDGETYNPEISSQHKRVMLKALALYGK
ncbi:MAG: DUF58 domain-containing protein [Nitrospirae bacterium]|nr:DUF58 domain-containing protein [Nitrospirota bacterium]